MKIVFFGTPLFAARTLSYLIQHKVSIVAVVTRPERPKGRSLKVLPSAVKETAIKEIPQIPVFEPEKASSHEFVEVLKAFEPDLFVVVAYGEILKKNLLDVPKKGSINVHASLLPKYRGAAPMQRSLMDGVTESGITIIDVAMQMDAGDILKMVKVDVPENMTFGELEEKLCMVACPALLSVIREIEKAAVTRISQDPAEVTFAPKILPEQEKINWDEPASKIHNLIRSLSPVPGAWCLVQIGEERKRLKIKRSQVIPDKGGKPKETLSYSEKGWIVACQEGALDLLEVQLEGKKSLSIKDFYLGMRHPPKIL